MAAKKNKLLPAALEKTNIPRKDYDTDTKRPVPSVAKHSRASDQTVVLGVPWVHLGDLAF